MPVFPWYLTPFRDDSAEQPSVTIESPSPAQDNKPTDQSKLAGRAGELRDTGEIERAQTPEFARVAAEVADSAALLDRSGVNTPQPEAPVSAHIQEVANIAAEVADTAEALDAGEVCGIGLKGWMVQVVLTIIISSRCPTWRSLRQRTRP